MFPFQLRLGPGLSICKFRFLTITIHLLSITCITSSTQLYGQERHGNAIDTNRGKKDVVNLYLTFDDGIIKSSQKVSALAMSEKAPITVFLIGKFVCENDTTRLQWVEDQHNSWMEAGNHSFTHADKKYYLYYQDPQHVVQDFQRNQDSLGFTNKLARLPGRNAWRLKAYSRDDLPDCKAAADSLASNGYTLIGWDLEWYYNASGMVLEPADDFLFRVEQLVKYKRTHIPNNIVILCHDPLLDNAYNELQVRSFIQKIRTKGNYRFRFLSDLTP